MDIDELGTCEETGSVFEEEWKKVACTVRHRANRFVDSEEGRSESD